MAVCLHGVSVHALALAVVVYTVFFLVNVAFFSRRALLAQARPAKVAHAEGHVKALDADAES